MRFFLNSSRSRQSEEALAGGDPESVIEELTKAAKADPSNLALANSLGDMYARAGRIPEAVSQFLSIALRYKREGYIPLSIAILKKISRLDPAEVGAVIKMADLLAEQGLKSEAGKHYLNAARASLNSSKFQEAIDCYEKASKLDPSNGLLLLELGEIYQRTRSLDKAHEIFMKAGRLLLRQNNREQARVAAMRIREIELMVRESAGGKGGERRLCQRLEVRSKSIVISKERGWREFTEALDISRLGLRFRLLHFVSTGSTLCVQLPMPADMVAIPWEMQLANVAYYKYTVNVRVCHRTQNSDGTHSIGAKFERILEISPEESMRVENRKSKRTR